MRYDSRLPRVVHALLRLNKLEAPLTSDALAEMLDTNPAVVRRTMAGLRRQGIVTATKGHGGGWALAKPLCEISLLRVYLALGSPTLFALGPADNVNGSPFERAANAATSQALEVAAEQFQAALAKVTMADVAADTGIWPNDYPLREDDKP